MIDLDQLHRDEGALRSEVESAGAVFRGRTCKCPYHDDSTPSGGIYCKEGRWSYKCHGCKFQGDIIECRAKRTGKTSADVLREMNADAAPLPIKPAWSFPSIQAANAGIEHREATYQYSNPATGAIELIVFRVQPPDGKKRFFQAHVQGGKIVMNAPVGTLPIYNRTRILSADTVVVVEGEKAVHALTALGVVATTSPGGAGKAGRADWMPLRGKRVILWPDHDADVDGVRKGHEHMRDVAKILRLQDQSAQLSWVDPDSINLPSDGSDVVDFIKMVEEGMGDGDCRAASVQAVLDSASALDGSGDLEKYIEEVISGKHRTIAFPFMALTRLTRSLMPGTITVLCGEGGTGKSLLAMQIIAWLHASGTKVAAFELEEDVNHHMLRALAQMDGNSELTDTEWKRTHPLEARAAYQCHREKITALTQCIEASPDAEVTHDQLLKWARARASTGCRVIFIDPITAAASSREPWISDLRFLLNAKKLARDFGISIVLVTHPTKGKKVGKPSNDDMAGGSAYARFVQSVIWISKPEKDKRVTVASSAGNFVDVVNRIVRLGKTRNGPGGGKEIAFKFDPGTLLFSEIGVIVKETPESVEDSKPSNLIQEPPPQQGSIWEDDHGR